MATITATRPPLLQPCNETEHAFSRITREGKKLTYNLKVIQQPERARACGAGAKSSADRRPVDPPPVVELHIYESDPNNDLHRTDITFAYNANFFLFATLETARPIAQGRSSGPPPACPVLTGCPVAGIAYLDRPSQAGYFIFPDLSVRHEGRYRLNFNLYEEIKDAKDADKDAPLTPQEKLTPITTTPTMGVGLKLSKPIAPKTFLHFRLEVKSIPFIVYSAKKFPGLATSTSLSRVVAEQGCRVRIRRDVRMRRRGGDKAKKDYSDYDDEGAYASSPRYTTPDSYPAPTPIERPRSTSNSTVETPYPYGPDAQRRPSMPEYGFPCPPPPAPPNASNYHSHLSFSSAPAHYQTPQLPPTAQSIPPPASYPSHPPLSHAPTSSSSAEHEPASPAYPYPARPKTEQRFNHEYPKPALPPLRLEPPKALNPQPYCEHRSSDPNAYQSSIQPSVRARTPISIIPPLPPLKELEYAQPPTPSSSHDPGSARRLLYETDSTISKRTHDETFGHQERPLQNGARPDTESYPDLPNGGRKLGFKDRYLYDIPASMEYRRADGSVSTKVRQAV